MRSRNVVLLFALLLASLVMTAPSAVFAQTETGRVTGTVTDPNDLVVPGATITLTSRTSGAIRTTVSDAVGRYVIANVPAGTYTLKVELSGFASQTSNLTVSVGSAVALDNKLRVAGTAESVSVTAEAPVVNISNAEVSTVVHQEQLRDLPLLTRNPYDLVTIAANVQDSPIEEKIRNNAYRGTGFSINGQRAASTNVMLDGSANNNEFDTTVGQDVPLDSVQEFSVVTNNFSAQYGRATGGIVNVITKSGGNAFTGTAYEFFRNDSLASNSPDNIANGIEKGKFKRNQPGYSLGGPIVKDRVHFFSSLEYIGVRSFDTQISWVPTAQFLAATSPATRAYFAAYDKGVQINGPTLTRSQVSALITGTGNGSFNSLPASLPVFGRVDKSLPIDAGGGDPQNDYQLVEKVDFNASADSQFYVRYAYQNANTFAGTNSASPYPGFDTGQINKRHNLLGSFTHVYSPRLTSQTKLVWNRLLNEQPTNGPAEPRLMMNPNGPILLQGHNIAFPGYLPWSPGNDIPFGGPQQLTQFYHDQTWLKGSHDLRFGGSYVHIKDDRTFAAYSNAVEFLNTTSTAITSLDNLVSGNILRFQAAINPQGNPGGTFVTPVQAPSFTSHNTYNEYALYAQDNWTKSRLTFNLGVRYEYYGPQTKSDPKYDSNFYYSDPNASVSSSSPQQIIDAIRGGSVLPSNLSPIGALWAPDRNNFAPRIGFAWDVTGDGRTSIRGGYGMAYERNFGNVTFNVLFNPPLYLVSTLDTGTSVGQLPSQPIYVDNGGPFAGVPGVKKTIPAGSLRHVDQNIKNAYTHQYGVSMEKQFGGGWAGSIEYNGSSGRSLYDLADVNKRGAPLFYEGPGGCTPACTPDTRPNPAFTAFNTRGNRGRSQYNGVTFSLDSRQIANTGLAITSKYTLSKAMDNLSSTFSDGNNGYFNLGYLDPFDPMLDWGPAEFDIRHRLSISAVWNLPFLNNGSGVMRTALGGWQLNTIFTARSGRPFSIFDCTNGRDACPRALDTANINKNATGNTPTGNPNEFELLDLAPILGAAGTYINPLIGVSDYGPYPANMTTRDAFRGPGYWNVDFGLNKRFRFGTNKAVQVRFEAFNLFNHANMYVHTDGADVSSATMITGYLDDYRRMQLGVKFEF